MFSAVHAPQPVYSCFLIHYITHCVKSNQTEPDSKQTKSLSVWKCLLYISVAHSHAYSGISETMVLSCRCFGSDLSQFSIKWKKSHKLFSVHFDPFCINVTSYKFGNVTHKNIQFASERWNLFFKLKQWTCGFSFHRSESVKHFKEPRTPHLLLFNSLSLFHSLNFVRQTHDCCYRNCMVLSDSRVFITETPASHWQRQRFFCPSCDLPLFQFSSQLRRRVSSHE